MEKLKRPVKIRRTKMTYVWYMMLVCVSPVFGHLLYFELGWYLLLACMVPWIIQFICLFQISENRETITIEANELENAYRREMMADKRMRRCFCFVAVLSLFPLLCNIEAYVEWNSRLLRFIIPWFWNADPQPIVMPIISGLVCVFVALIQLMIATITEYEEGDKHYEYPPRKLAYDPDYEETDVNVVYHWFKDKGKTPDELAADAIEQQHREELAFYGEDYIVVDRDAKVFVNEVMKQFFIDHYIIFFDEILDFIVQDNEETAYTTYSTQSIEPNGKTAAGMLFGRMAGGNVGAVLGGLAAMDVKETTHVSSYTNHDYSIVIYLNNINDPIVRINLGGNSSAMHRISGVLNVIVNQNRQQL